MEFCSLPIAFNRELFSSINIQNNEEIEEQDSMVQMQLHKCQSCGKQFQKKNKLQRHYNETHMNIKQFKCETCQKEFKRSQHLKRHLLIHENLRPFACAHENCPQSFTCKHHLKRHIQLIHDKREIYQCSDCDFSTMKKKQLNKHKLEHSKITEPAISFVCKRCPKSFTRLRNLHKHVLVAHDKLKAFKCNECEQSFAHKCTLNRHILKLHK